MDHFEDHMHSVWTEWAAVKDKWFHGEKMDPVFEGVVRDFCVFDDTMHNIYVKVGNFMKGIDQLAAGMTALSEGVSKGLAHSDSQISSDSCKLKEATNQIARADAPHSAVAKLRRDMHFNIMGPVQNHIANNRNLKVSLDIRRRRLVELNSAKKQYEDCVKKNLSHQDRRFLSAKANYESAKMTFNDVDRHVFEWLYILEEYRGDILDSTLQTLKYLQYEFFATSAHAISSSLPSRMEFRPMVEMTPEHLEAQVEMELQESEEAATEDVADFSTRLIDKRARDDPGDDAPSMPVDPLSLSSLLSQGFEEGPARRALRLHQNSTQAALDWLINGSAEEEEKKKQVSEGVRMPTTVKRVQKLKAMRKAQQERQRRKDDREQERDRDRDRDRDGDSGGRATEQGRDSGGDRGGSGATASSNGNSAKGQAPAAQPDMLSGDALEEPATASVREQPAPATDLLSLNDESPTDFSKEIESTPLPTQLAFDASRCEKQPLAAAVAAGIAQPRAGGGATSSFADGFGMTSLAPQASSAAVAGISAELLSTVQALTAQSQFSPEQLLLAAQQLQAQNKAGVQQNLAGMQAMMAPAAPSSETLMSPPWPGADVASAAAPASGSLNGAWPANLQSGPKGPPPQGAGAPMQAMGFAALDPMAAGSAPMQPPLPSSGYPAAAPAPGNAGTSVASGDRFGDLVNFTTGSK
mmetsp:Transcript_79717/g.221857  ORF Transcript_79717/g.221857 Transcript_79717/m.221857 type:complete len:696 (+) Transcript_79717:154-2241(+)